MYKITKMTGKILAYIICALTIDLIELTDSILLNYFIISPIITWLITKASYYTCRIIVYRKMNINEPTIGSAVYWISYIVYVFLLFAVLSILKIYNIIPICTDLDKRIFYGIVNFFYRILSYKMNDIVNVLQT